MALTKEDLQAIGSLMDTKLNPIVERLDNVEREVKLMKETQSKRYSQLASKVEKTNALAKKNAEDIKKLY